MRSLSAGGPFPSRALYAGASVARLSQPAPGMWTTLDPGVPRLGETVGGKYLVDGICGLGQSAVVLAATRVPHGPRVAIEVLRPEWAQQGLVVARFLREGEAAMRIRSEHAVRVLDQGVLENGVPYLVLEYVEGRSLENIVWTQGRLPVPTVVDWHLQAIEAIAQAHSHGIVHGDLTPAKVFLTWRPDGTPCIKVDFDLQNPTEPRGSFEDRAAEGVDVGPDVQALGAVLHVLLTGGPWTGDDDARRAREPHALDEVVRRCLGEPRARFASVAELARELAPFGTSAGRASCERIECLLEGRVRALTRPEPSGESSARDPSIYPRAFAAPASGRVVFLALTMLALLGAGALASMYLSVFRGAPHSIGVAEMQPSAPAAK
jgi:serine/threonine protein kinase